MFLSEAYPDLVKFYDKGNEIPANKCPTTYANTRKIKWVCPRCKKRHIKNLSSAIVSGAYCQPCARALPAPGKSLKDLYPRIAEMYDRAGNTIQSSMLSPAVSKKVFLVCDKGHRFDVLLSNAVKRGASYKCPVCEGYRVAVGENDLKSKYPNLATMYSKANTTPFSQLVESRGSTSYEWVCPNGHKFVNNVHYMTAMYNSDSMGCPICLKESTDPWYKKYPSIVKMWDTELNSITIEQSELKQWGDSYWFKCENGHSLNCTVYSLVRSLGKKSHGCPYCEKSYSSVETGLESVHGSIIERYWDSSKNIEDIKTIKLKEQKKKYWWLCDKQHSFFETPQNVLFGQEWRTNGCPICGRKYLVEGANSIVEETPWVLDYWDYKKNEESPEKIKAYSDKKYYFKCKNGHSMYKSIRSFCKDINNKYAGCPICSNLVTVTGENDLATVKPGILKFWDYDRNTQDPKTVNCRSDSKYYFKCRNNHSVYMSVRNFLNSSKTKSCGCLICKNIKILPGFNDLATTHPELVNSYPSDLNPDTPITSVSHGSEKRITCRCQAEGCTNTFQTPVWSFVSGARIYCDEHSGISMRSLACRELETWLIDNGVDVCSEARVFKSKKKRADLYIADKNLVIEYNGLYWHSESYVGKMSHYERYKELKELGLSLYCVWEDDWASKKEIVKMAILRRLGISGEERVNARDCSIKTIDSCCAKKFLEENHIQGFVAAECYLGLIYKDSVVAVMCISCPKKDIIIQRYATNCILRGGFSKLVKYIENTYCYSSLVTFSDNDVSDGLLYLKNGFRKKLDIAPDYKYIVDGKRVHKFNFRKERFRSDHSLKYEEGLTEIELANLNNLDRVWDAGKIKWVKENPRN